uniref:Uncharacterized protein n=1 Tax=Oryza brachyantha TaxID=4533 RepID=J3N190_ORYBR
MAMCARAKGLAIGQENWNPCYVGATVHWKICSTNTLNHEVNYYGKYYVTLKDGFADRGLW